MGIWDSLKQQAGAQMLEVIDWTDDSNDTLVYRVPTHNQAITDKSKVVVREGQACVFLSEGKLSEVFGPGTYALDTRNAPLMRFFQSIAYKLEEPYKGDVYFMNTRQYTDNGWGTQRPVMVRDAEFGPVRIRAFGIFSYRITDPAVFLRQLVGTDGLFTTDEINGQLKRKLVATLAQTIGQSQIAVLDLAANYQDLGDQLRDQINPAFAELYGITLTDFTISSVNLPEEVEEALDTRSKIGILGNLNAYTQLKAADAIEHAAKNTGVGGIGASMGVGFGVGNQVGANIANAQGAAPPPPPQQGVYHYTGPGGQAQLSLAEVVQRVSAHPSASHSVWQPGWAEWKPPSAVAPIAAQLPPAPPGAAGPPPLPGEARFHYNGPDGQAQRTLAEVVAAVQAAPDAAHLVWQPGWEVWKAPADVPALAAQLAGPPPLPPGA